MNEQITLTTDRLILRPWIRDDLETFARMNADFRVMEYFPSVKSFDESREEYNRIVNGFEKYGWGLWAVSVVNGPGFIGFIGLNHVNFDAHFTPAVEIGWRILFEEWRKGYATEGAIASLKFGFGILKLKEVVSFTAVQNMRSRAVMERIGMHHDIEGDFDHSKLPEGHPLRRHVLYRVNAMDWVGQSSPGGI
ncbi:MAG TPA: GNAT family N-acetyltransferase [Chlamydiales bacterium]|nr:GNAT family N-acetyltransferase [Chlamydiales bacterium]